MTQNLVRVHYFAVMVTGMQFLQFFFYESQVEYLIKALIKERKNVNDFFIAVLLYLYDLN